MGVKTGRYFVNYDSVKNTSTDLAHMVEFDRSSSFVDDTLAEINGVTKASYPNLESISLSFLYYKENSNDSTYKNDLKVWPARSDIYSTNFAIPYSTALGTTIDVVQAGYCPMISRLQIDANGTTINQYNLYTSIVFQEITGTESMTYTISRSDTQLEISNQGVTISYEKDKFPNNTIPHRLYVIIQAAGGGGAAGYTEVVSWGGAGGGGGGAYWAGIINLDAGEFTINMGAIGKGATAEKTDGSGASNSSLTVTSGSSAHTFNIGGGKAGTQSAGGNGGNVGTNGTSQLQLNNKTVWWYKAAISGEKGESPNQDKAASEKTYEEVYLSQSNIYKPYSLVRGGNSRYTGKCHPNSGGGGGGCSFMGDGGEAGAGVWGSTTSKAGGTGAGGGGGGAGQNPGNNGGNWFLGIYY